VASAAVMAITKWTISGSKKSNGTAAQGDAAKPVGSSYSDFGGLECAATAVTCRPPRQVFALNLSAKRRLCNTVGGRFIDGTARCAVLAARSRAATMTNFARSSLVLVLRAFHGGAKSCALVNFFMICPPLGW
jgi:hypothetical protein